MKPCADVVIALLFSVMLVVIVSLCGRDFRETRSISLRKKMNFQSETLPTLGGTAVEEAQAVCDAKSGVEAFACDTRVVSAPGWRPGLPPAGESK